MQHARVDERRQETGGNGRSDESIATCGGHGNAEDHTGGGGDDDGDDEVEGHALVHHLAVRPLVRLAYVAQEQAVEATRQVRHNGHLELVHEARAEEVEVRHAVAHDHAQDRTHDRTHEHRRDREHQHVRRQTAGCHRGGAYITERVRDTTNTEAGGACGGRLTDEVHPGVDVDVGVVGDLVEHLLGGLARLLEMLKALQWWGLLGFFLHLLQGELRLDQRRGQIRLQVVDGRQHNATDAGADAVFPEKQSKRNHSLSD